MTFAAFGTKFHIYLLWGQCLFSIVSKLILKCESSSSCFQPGEGPSRGLLGDCTTSPINRLQHYTLYFQSYPSITRLTISLSPNTCYSGKLPSQGEPVPGRQHRSSWGGIVTPAHLILTMGDHSHYFWVVR